MVRIFTFTRRLDLNTGTDLLVMPGIIDVPSDSWTTNGLMPRNVSRETRRANTTAKHGIPQGCVGGMYLKRT